MATDMEVEKDVTTQLEGEQQRMLPEAVEIEKEELKSEELGHLKDTVETSNDVSNVNDVEMTAVEDIVVKDGCGDVPAVVAEETVVEDGGGVVPAVVAEEIVVEDGGGDVPAVAEKTVVKDGCGDVPAAIAEDIVVRDGCGDVPAAVAEAVVRDGCEDVTATAEDTVVRDVGEDVPAAAQDTVVRDGFGVAPASSEDTVVKDGCVGIPAATGTTVSADVSNVEASGGDDVGGRTGEDDKKSHNLESQGVAVVASNDSSPEVKGKDKKDEELTNAMNGMDTTNEALAPGSGEDNGSKEEELNNGEAQTNPANNDGNKMDTSTDTLSDLDVLQENGTKEELSKKFTGMDMVLDNELKGEVQNPELDTRQEVFSKTSNNSFLGPDPLLGDETGTEEERAEFMKELETFHKERSLEFKPPRFYQEPLNCLKLWRSVVKLGGYEQVTSCKLWRQVGESFNPPKTCTTVSWTFRCFYEKSLLEYEKYKMRSGELPFTDVSFPVACGAGDQAGHNQAAGPGRARRDSAARAMQGWHSQHVSSNGDVGDQINKDKDSSPVSKREKQLKSIGLLKRKTPPPMDDAAKVAGINTSKQQLDTMVVDIGTPADWVKINVQKTKDCFEIYALVPGLLREEVRVQSDPAGHLIISGEPENIDNPWGVVPFKKIVSLPSRIDPQQTSALVTLHGQLFLRVPFEQSNE
ncbi:AT-rich interactive domain-containing protein 3 [Heracleum sosnowskyi]|uniref:AT-rich interactive domain-containing protein 3 n=1 Tax=Heracleum sosnowskyi TaxID=360622 RepID=A0AAD8MZK7_9APIA|nr:AT-rich interactive domain-containing protein 3 [Heracleum sosnowskyi]